MTTVHPNGRKPGSRCFRYSSFCCLIITLIPNTKNIKLQLIEILYQYGVITNETLAEAHQKFPDSEDDRVKYYMEVAAQSEMGQAIIAQVNAQYEQTPYALYAGSSPKGNRSEALAAYGYGELCMELDFFHGLKDAHHITKFADYFMQIGKSVALLNPDPLAVDQVIFDMASYWLDDGHSGSVSHSYLIDSDTDNHDRLGFSLSSRANLSQTMAAIRAQYPESQLPYYEVGNTAYVTFDHFQMDQAFDYYAAAEKGEMPDPAMDTLSLAYYAHQQITRENSPIENVVLDLSANGGGMAPTALWMVSWFLGEAQMSVYHTATGAESTVVYRADVNFDHQYDEKDTIWCMNRHPALWLTFFPKALKNLILYKKGKMTRMLMMRQFFSFLGKVKNFDSEIEKYWNKHEKNISAWYLAQKKPDDLIITASPACIIEPIARREGTLRYRQSANRL